MRRSSFGIFPTHDASAQPALIQRGATSCFEKPGSADAARGFSQHATDASCQQQPLAAAVVTTAGFGAR
jgi:hypothetical protein